MGFKIIHDNIVSLSTSVEAIINSSNAFISSGGGVSGAIHKAAGESFTHYCIKLGGLRTTECKITPAFGLPYNYVIHALAPVYDKSLSPYEELEKTYLNALVLAEKTGIKSIASPLLGSGHYKYPTQIAIEIALQAIESFCNENPHITVFLICFTVEEFNLCLEMQQGMLME